MTELMTGGAAFWRRLLLLLFLVVIGIVGDGRLGPAGGE